MLEPGVEEMERVFGQKGADEAGKAECWQAVLGPGVGGAECEPGIEFSGPTSSTAPDWRSQRRKGLQITHS